MLSLLEVLGSTGSFLNSIFLEYRRVSSANTDVPRSFPQCEAADFAQGERDWSVCVHVSLWYFGCVLTCTCQLHRMVWSSNAGKHFAKHMSRKQRHWGRNAGRGRWRSPAHYARTCLACSNLQAGVRSADSGVVGMCRRTTMYSDAA